MRYAGISLGHGANREAEHWISTLGLPAGVEACTHLARTPYPHVVVSLALPDGVDTELPVTPDDLSRSAAEAAADHAGRRGGRAFLFAGVEALTGTMTVADVLAKSAISRVKVLGGPDPEPEREILTRDFIRPEWKDGALTLMTSPGPRGRLAPFEFPNPTPCCGGDH
ncbi:hypothetical protein GCM10022251_21310 [Phytohabitans flavus]|uniref:Uncharacterized protein n=1 Tax=Phytohabitans flavus TaxID=1076124 RepID=A0A6F8XZT2_9ACTN|nr:hypothetical protein [Phytohabitans flavus]BCB79335.1 hypothetical protein Pflav_057450 [Phytohabitans flavus]